MRLMLAGNRIERLRKWLLARGTLNLKSLCAGLGVLALCVSGPLAGDEFSYAKAGREHPFSALAMSDRASPQADPEIKTGGYQLVGTLGHGTSLDALVRLPNGLTRRLAEGESFDSGRARVLEVAADRMHMQVHKEITTLYLAVPRQEEPTQ